MKAVFFAADRPDTPIASVTWSKDGPTIPADDDAARAEMEAIFHRIPVVVDDPSLRSFGTAGPVVLQPGTVRWFRAAAEVRGTRRGLQVRFVADDAEPVGWDPAGAYRPFDAVVEGRS
jgi:hypothetical protein